MIYFEYCESSSTLFRRRVRAILIGIVIFWTVTAIFQTLPILILSTVATVGGVFGLAVARRDRGKVGDFHLILDDEALTYTTPSWTMGSSFTLPLNDISKVMREEVSESSPLFEIETNEGKRFHLSTAVNCDYDSLFSKIQQLKPDVTRISR